MTGRTFLTLGLALVLSSDVCADDIAGGPPRPKLFASEYGTYAFKVLSDASSVCVRTRAEGLRSPAEAGQIAGDSEGVFFTLDEHGRKKVIWRNKLVNIPNRAILVENGKYVITLDSWRSIGFDHCLVVYGEQGQIIADFKLEDLLTPQEIEVLPASLTHRGWSDKDIAEFEDRSREEGELVIRMQHKDWTKVIRLSLSSGRIINDGLSAELSNVVVRTDNKIELDFVLANHSDASIVLAERWNSWGAYQWQFRVVDAKGTEYVLRNPQMAWYRNFLTTFTIPPSKNQVTRCRLDRTSWQPEDGTTAVFSGAITGADGKRPQNTWVFPLSITGTFSAPTFSAPTRSLVDGEKLGRDSIWWEGTIATNTVKAGKAPKPEPPGDGGRVPQPKDAGSSELESAKLVVAVVDAELPCGVGRVQKNAVWNEPYRYVFRDFPDYLANAQHIFMRQNGGGATGRWLETGQVKVSQPCWLFAAVHQPSDAQREIWKTEGWEIPPDVLVDLGDPRFLPREVRKYVLMRKRIDTGRVNFDTRAAKTPMVIWMFQELERAD